MTDNDREYNGWTNWDTWAFALWVDNTELSYKTRMEICRCVAEQGSGVTVLGEELERLSKHLLIVSGCTDRIALDSVDFHEIAEHWWEDVEEYAPSEESEYDRRMRDEDEEGDILMRRDKEDRED